MPLAVTEKSILEKAVSSYTINQKFHLCIHDTSGILHNNPALYLPLHFCIHSSLFCQIAKTTAVGTRFCLRCKGVSLRKSSIQRETYVGQCYLGLTEIVRPVIIHERLVCVIYLGNILIDEQSNDVYRRIDRVANITGVNRSALKDSLQNTHIIKEKEISRYYDMLDILEHLIKSYGFQYTNSKK